jgi:collagenase-like PrtC family protease
LNGIGAASVARTILKTERGVGRAVLRFEVRRATEAAMIRSFIVASGVAAIAFGVQCFFFQALVVETDAQKTVAIADFWPYSMICTGLVVYLYGTQLQK